DPDYRIEVDDLIAATPDAYEALWRYLCGVDLVTTVRAWNRPVDEPLPLLLADARAARQVSRTDQLWLRVLDVPKALSSRTYLSSGRVVLEVLDPDGPSAGKYALEGGPDGASCEPTNDDPDIVLPVATLGAAYLGGTTMRRLAAGRWVAWSNPKGLAVADAMFRAATAPWCTTWF